MSESPPAADATTEAVERFITRWQMAGGSERANYQLFLTELGALLDLPHPDPASDDTRDNAYVFERRVHFKHGDGTDSFGFIDLYRRRLVRPRGQEDSPAADRRVRRRDAAGAGTGRELRAGVAGR